MHCTLLSTENLQVIIGDAARNGVGRQQYCGLWSLTERTWPFNIFGGTYAWLIPGDGSPNPWPHGQLRQSRRGLVSLA
jgi:hypothetical protein